MVGALVVALVVARVALAPPRLVAAALRLACVPHNALPVNGGGAAQNLADRDLRE